MGGKSEPELISTRAPADGWTEPSGPSPRWPRGAAAQRFPANATWRCRHPHWWGCAGTPPGPPGSNLAWQGREGGLRGGKGRGSQAQGLKSLVEEPALMLQNPGAPSGARGGPGTGQKPRVNENSARHPVKPILSRSRGADRGGGPEGKGSGKKKLCQRKMSSSFDFAEWSAVPATCVLWLVWHLQVSQAYIYNIVWGAFDLVRGRVLGVTREN